MVETALLGMADIVCYISSYRNFTFFDNVAKVVLSECSCKKSIYKIKIARQGNMLIAVGQTKSQPTVKIQQRPQPRRGVEQNGRWNSSTPSGLWAVPVHGPRVSLFVLSFGLK